MPTYDIQGEKVFETNEVGKVSTHLNPMSDGVGVKEKFDDIETQISEIPSPPSVITGTGSELNLSSIVGAYYNMITASSSSVFTTVSEVPGGFAVSLINRSTEPTVTGATKIKGSEFVASTDMHLFVQYFGEDIQYFFAEL